MTVKIDVIIPTLNEADHIKKCLGSVIKQKLSMPILMEVIVVDGGSIDATVEKVLKFNVRVLLDHGTLGSSRQTGIINSNADYVAFIDADEVAAESWLEELYRSCSEGYDAAIGTVVPLGDTKTQRAYRNLYFLIPRNKKAYNSLFPTANLMVRRDVALKVGFDPRLRIGEDADFSLRFLTKYKVIINPGAVVYHRVPKDLAEALKQEIKYGHCCMAFFRKSPNVKVAIYLMQSLFYTISPVFYGRVAKAMASIGLFDGIFLCVFGIVKFLGILIGFLF